MVRWLLGAGIVAPLTAAGAVLGTGAAATAGAAVQSAGSCHGPADFGRVYLGAVWPGGFRGVRVYSNGVSGSFTDCLHSTRTPSGRVVVDGYAWQCVELVDRLYLSKGWIRSPWLGNGNQLFATAPRFMREQRQGSVNRVWPGDVISFDAPGGRGAGHAAVIARVQGSYLTIVNQNTDRANVLSHAYLRHGRIEMVGWPGWTPIGVVHAPVRHLPPLRVASGSSASARVDDGYFRAFSSTGGSGHDRWSVTGGALPAGLAMTPSGQLKGVALTTGRYRFAATARDSAGQRASATVQMRVSGGTNLLADAGFTTPRLTGWRTSAVSGTPVAARRATGVSGLPHGSSELVLSSSRRGAALYQSLRAPVAVGESYTFAGWVRSASASPVRVCYRLDGLARDGARLASGTTCRRVGRAFVRLAAPLDIDVPRVARLRASVVLGSAPAAVELDAMKLDANGLGHASFARDEARDWHLAPARKGTVVNGHAYSAPASQLPAGTNFFQMNTSVPGASLSQVVPGSLPLHQHFRFSAFVRAKGRTSARVCLVLSGLGRTHTARTCRQVGSTWRQLSVSYAVASAGQHSLQSKVVLDSRHQNLDVAATALVNSGA